MDINIISLAFVDSVKRRRASGEPRYRAVLPDGLYVGCYLNAVKKASALRMFSSPSINDWVKQIPLEYRDQLDRIIIEKIR